MSNKRAQDSKALALASPTGERSGLSEDLTSDTAGGRWLYLPSPGEEKGVADVKAVPASMARSAALMVRPVLRRALRERRPMKNGTVRVTLWQKIAQTQATTALLTASALQPGSSTGFSEFATLYDEARCLGVTVHCRALAGSGVGGIDSWSAAFDPSVAGNLASVVGGLEQKYKTGPNAVLLIGQTQENQSTSTGPGGFYKFSAKTVPSIESVTSADKIGSNWFPTTATGSVIGYLKPYVENASGAGTSYFTAFIAYDMEFKYRG